MHIFAHLSLLLPVLGAISCRAEPTTGWASQRQTLVSSLEKKGITDRRVLQAVNAVPRHRFVPEAWRELSYVDRPLPIGREQTISQPFIVAYMCQEAWPDSSDAVLEIGTGSGYHAAVMSLLCSRVFTIEIIPELGKAARELLARLGYDNVTVRIGDGYQGWKEHAPFDAIILTAAPPEIPDPLLHQLKIGGRLVAPVGEDWQQLVRVVRTAEGFEHTPLLPVAFVPMTGEAERKR